MVQIAIAGGGSVGLVLARLLARRGITVCLIARAEPVGGFRPIALSQPSFALCESLVPIDPATATAIETVHVSQRHAPGRTRMNGAEHGLASLGQVIELADLSAQLAAGIEACAPELQRCTGSVTGWQASHASIRIEWESPEGSQNPITARLLVLADGVRQVAAGDLTPKAALQTRDELGGLTRSFADMTQQLADARSAVDQSMSQVNAARANLQTILDNLTAGVIVLDQQGRILSSNPGATRILRAPLAAHEGKLLREIDGLHDFAQGVQQQFDEFLGERSLHGAEHWQHSFELNATQPGLPQNPTNLIARGAPLPAGELLLVFDDISEIVSGQRAQAWAEVARRLAHEIKNPHTPIQLSAERLEMKLNGKVGEAEQAILTKSVKTIVDQVDAMKRLVNEFRDYARLPAAELKPVDLNALIAELLLLYNPENALVPVHSELDPACPPILGDDQQLRQVIHNLVQNAQDATEGAARREVLIRTQWVAASRRVRLSVRDSGPGFAEHILKRAFEPYVTTKAKGTGLGLAVVKKIADDHGARIAISNRIDDGQIQGAQVSLSFAVAG